MVNYLISFKKLLKFKANFSEPYKRTVSNWSFEEFWRVESNLYTPLKSSAVWIKVVSGRGHE